MTWTTIIRSGGAPSLELGLYMFLAFRLNFFRHNESRFHQFG
jgi:hypothetical protein